ncbi:MAG: hypothetical protein QM759_06005 [Terricaulis sp.]
MSRREHRSRHGPSRSQHGDLPHRSICRRTTSMIRSASSEALVLQRVIAFVFFTLGGWCLVAPASVIALTVRPAFQSFAPFTLVVGSAFGAQAVLAGLFAALSRFNASTFAAFAISLLPFFVFDWWFYQIEPIFNELIALDVVGNSVMLALSVRGFLLLQNNAPAS